MYTCFSITVNVVVSTRRVSSCTNNLPLCDWIFELEKKKKNRKRLGNFDFLWWSKITIYRKTSYNFYHKINRTIHCFFGKKIYRTRKRNSSNSSDSPFWFPSTISQKHGNRLFPRNKEEKEKTRSYERRLREYKSDFFAISFLPLFFSFPLHRYQGEINATYVESS